MALLTALDLPAAQRLGAAYDLEITAIEPLSAGSVNSNFRLWTGAGQVLFGRIYEEQGAAGAAWEARLLRTLQQAHVPVAPPLTPKSPQTASTGHQGKPVALYEWVAGHSLCHALVTPAHCEQLGRALARVHLTSPSLEPIPQGRFGVAALSQRLAFIQRQSSEFAATVDWIESRLSRYVATRCETLPGGVTHGDLFRDNVLWQGEQLAALIDFESACQGVFIYDLLVCVLAWCYTSGFELARARALVAGYESVRPLTQLEREHALNEATLACLRFTTTRITDFALRTPPGQTPARDYRRFMQRLEALEAGALHQILAP